MPEHQDLLATSLKLSGGKLYLLDQRLLPAEVVWRCCEEVDDVIDCIQTLAVRGAPLIGIAAALMVGILAQRGASHGELIEAIQRLRGSRPTAVNLKHYLDQLQGQLQAGLGGADLLECARQIFAQDQVLCQHMASHGAALIQPGANILTHCNTGSLATAGAGTALGVIAKAHEQGKGIHVWVSETRPLMQGARLTAWEMAQAEIDYHLICDHMAASLMAAGKVDLVLVGADRIAANGDSANKIGTYTLAVAAHYHKVPFYIVAPRTTVDPACPDGSSIEIEQREPREVRGFADHIWAPLNAPVLNPAFDVTPAALITAWILDDGVLDQGTVSRGALTKARFDVT